MYGFTLEERRDVDLRELFGLEPVSLEMKKGGLGWLGYVDFGIYQWCRLDKSIVQS